MIIYYILTATGHPFGMLCVQCDDILGWRSVDLKGWLQLIEAQGRKPWDITYVYLKKKKMLNAWLRPWDCVIPWITILNCESKGRRFSKLVSFCCVVVSTDHDRRASCVNFSLHCKSSCPNTALLTLRASRWKTDTVPVLLSVASVQYKHVTGEK